MDEPRSEEEVSIKEYQDQEILEDENTQEEESVGTTVKSSVKKIAGSNPLVGQEIADNSYTNSEKEPSNRNSNKNTVSQSQTSQTTTTSTSSSNTQTTSKATSDVPTKTPSTYTANSSVSSNSSTNNIVSSAQTRRFGVVTGDTTNIFPYALSGALSAMIAILTAATMRGRKKVFSADDKEE